MKRLLTGKIINITNKSKIDFLKIKYQKEYSLNELDGIIQKLLNLCIQKKKDQNKDINFKVKLIVLDSETKAIRFDMNKDETIKINASLSEDTTLRSLLEEEIELQRYDLGEGQDNFDKEKEKFLKDYDESYNGKVTKKLDEKAIGKPSLYTKVKNLLFKDKSQQDSQKNTAQEANLTKAFDDDEEEQEEQESLVRSNNQNRTTESTASEQESDESATDESVDALFKEKAEDGESIKEDKAENAISENIENGNDKPGDADLPNNIHEHEDIYGLTEKKPTIPIEVPKYTEKEITLKHSDDPFEQKQNEYIYDRLLNKEAHKLALYEELKHKLEYQFVVYVNDKRKHIEKVKNDNEMSQEEFDHLSNNISQQVQKDIDQNVKEYVKGQENKLKNFTQQQEKVLEEFKTKQHQELTQQKEIMEKEKQDYLKDTEEERVMRVSSEQMQIMDENERKINAIVAEENQSYDFKIQEALNQDCKQLIDEIDEKLFKFDDETYQQLLHKREAWKEELNKAKQLEIQEEQAKNEQLKIQQNIKEQEAIIAQQQREEQEIRRIREEKEKLAEKNKESELQLELARTKNEQERLAQEDRRISDSEKQTNLREQELVQSKEKNSHMTEVLMAQVMNNNKKETPTTAQLPKPRENTKTTSESKTNQSNILKSVGIFLLSAVVLIGIFLGGFFADHYIHILNCLPITMNHTQLIEPPFQLLK